MTLHRSTAEERALPWGRAFAVEDVFDLSDRGAVLQVRATIPGSECVVRISLQGKPSLEVVGYVNRPVGDAVQSAVLLKGVSAAEIPRGAIVEFLPPNGGYLPPMHKLYLIAPGPRPPFYEVAQALWGNADFDSDGDSDTPDAVDWTELTLSRRPDEVERVDVDPVGGAGPLVLCIKSENAELTRRAADFLWQRAGGSLSASTP